MIGLMGGITILFIPVLGKPIGILLWTFMCKSMGFEMENPKG